MFECRHPAHDLVPSFIEMRDARVAVGENGWTERGEELAHTDPYAYADLMNERTEGRSIPDGWVRSEELWIVEDRNVVGAVTVRHELNDWLRKIGGHIGYVTHLAHRNRGIATFALKSALDVLRVLGANEALVTCSEQNEASIRVIEKCGGHRIDDTVFPGHPDFTRRRYVFPLNVTGDGSLFANRYRTGP